MSKAATANTKRGPGKRRKTGRLVPLTFKVTPAFNKAFRDEAHRRNIKLVELLELASLALEIKPQDPPPEE